MGRAGSAVVTQRRFGKLLIANRGEIALRIVRSARRLGYATVAVYSDADRDAPHVAEADQAVHIGAPAAADSYLRIPAILAAAEISGADAVHPGYGFLSENAAFAHAVEDAGLVFIGPDPAAIAAMGDKRAAKIRMQAAGVACIPGYQGEDQSDATLLAEAQHIGLPLVIKATAGGGGRGMRRVDDPAQLAAALRSARSEAKSAFGRDGLLIEKAITDGRHVEIQVFGDRHGNVVFIGERDCSVQRRHQKIVEEAPSPAVDEALRARMGAAAVAAARAVHYVGAGTVEFMLAADGAFYFLEMNTRLQVEHPVTELVYGLDLVEWQLRVAQGEALPMSQEELLARRHGHAIEVRLCTEDPQQGYLPQTGTVLDWQPPQGAGIRVDTWLRTGTQIGPHYDSMQAKLIAWGEDRDTARRRLLKALADTVLLGVTSNRDHLAAIVAHPQFARGDVTTGFLDAGSVSARSSGTVPNHRHVALAAVALYLDDARRLREQHELPDELVGWHSAQPCPLQYKLRWRDQCLELQLLVEHPRRFTVHTAGTTVVVDLRREMADGLDYGCQDVEGRARIARSGDTLWIDAEGSTQAYTDVSFAPAAARAPGSDGRLCANSDGKIIAVHVKPGDRVEKGSPLVVLEAMKMEFQLSLPLAGTVTGVKVEVGQQVKNRQLLAEIAVD
jgi:geranyl-CoA carboxylase alpha subunit